MGRILGLDYGAKTIGVALCDPFETIASPIETITRKREGKIRASLRRILELVTENDVKLVVLGYPLNMNGTKGERAIKTEKFKEKLEERLRRVSSNIPVVLWDERLSTIEAMEVLSQINGSKKTDKESIDCTAASLILKDFLDNKRKIDKGELTDS